MDDARVEPAGRDWERWLDRALLVVPWVLLVLSSAIALGAGGQTATGRAVTLGLVLATAGWVYLGHTRTDAAWRRRTVPMLIYFVGLLGFSVALMSRDQVFVLFTITGFFHAYQLRPWPLGVAGVFATSVVLNTMTIRPDPGSAAELGVYLGVIAVQTVAIGAGRVLGEKMSEQHERRRETVARLAAALEENAGLQAQLVTQAREAGVLDERQRMAGEIHDNLAQGLAGIITQLQAAQRVWHQPGTARGHVDRALALARSSLTEARRSVQALRPAPLADAQLPEALRELTRRWADDTGHELRFEVTGERVPLSPAIEEALYRVTQEALTNVARHARASRVGVTLSYLPDVVLLDVRDDGRGMADPDRTGTGFGLPNMRQRVRSVGGALEIETAVGAGTTVNVRVPAIVAVTP